MAFVFSQSGQNQIGTWIRVWFLGSYDNGVRAENSFLLSWASFSEHRKLFLSPHPAYLPSLDFSWLWGIDQIIIQRESLSSAFPERRVFFLPRRCWVCPYDYLLGLLLGRVYIPTTWLSWVNGVLADVMGAEAWNVLSGWACYPVPLPSPRAELPPAVILSNWIPEWTMWSRPERNLQWGPKPHQTHSLKQSHPAKASMN